MSILKTGRPSATNKENAIASVQGNEEESIRMNINMPKSFYRKIKQFALDQDTTVTEVVIKSLEIYISK